MFIYGIIKVVIDMSNRDEFLEKIKNVEFKSKDDYKEYLENKVSDVIDIVTSKYKNPENIENLDYIVAGIYLSLKNVLPDGIGFRIEYREKSFRSTQKSSSSEILRSDVEKITKDIFGMKIIITDIDSALEFDDESINFDKLIELQNIRIKNISFIETTRNWLNSDSTHTIKTEDEYYKKLKELLECLNKSTYPECTTEVEVPYSEKLDIIKKIYTKKKEQDQLSFNVSREQMNTMSELLSELEDRLDDKLEREILKTYLPKALSSNLVSNILNVKYSYEKETIKPNGYVADFYAIHVNAPDKNNGDGNDGKETKNDNEFVIELQAQSFYRYLCGKTGIAYHNGILGKSINIDSLFELVDPNDTMTLETYLIILSQVPISTFEKGIIETEHSPLIQKVEEAYKHIKIKDTIKFDNLDYNMNEYLMNLAKYVASNMSVCRSSHDLTTPTVAIEHKGLAAGFSDVLRKKDGISCLAQLLVDRVESIVDTIDNNSDLLPKYTTLTVRDIINHSNKLKQKQIETNNSREDTSR